MPQGSIGNLFFSWYKKGKNGKRNSYYGETLLVGRGTYKIKVAYVETSLKLNRDSYELHILLPGVSTPTMEDRDIDILKRYAEQTVSSWFNIAVSGISITIKEGE
jgi:hypothetical protein